MTLYLICLAVVYGAAIACAVYHARRADRADRLLHLERLGRGHVDRELAMVRWELHAARLTAALPHSERGRPARVPRSERTPVVPVLEAHELDEVTMMIESSGPRMKALPPPLPGAARRGRAEPAPLVLSTLRDMPDGDAAALDNVPMGRAGS